MLGGWLSLCSILLKPLLALVAEGLKMSCPWTPPPALRALCSTAKAEEQPAGDCTKSLHCSNSNRSSEVWCPFSVPGAGCGSQSGRWHSVGHCGRISWTTLSVYDKTLDPHEIKELMAPSSLRAAQWEQPLPAEPRTEPPNLSFPCFILSLLPYPSEFLKAEFFCRRTLLALGFFLSFLARTLPWTTAPDLLLSFNCCCNVNFNSSQSPDVLRMHSTCQGQAIYLPGQSFPALWIQWPLNLSEKISKAIITYFTVGCWWEMEIITVNLNANMYFLWQLSLFYCSLTFGWKY